MIGPFTSPPFADSCFSPLNSVPKKDTSERRLILDMSYPPDNNINQGIHKDWYLDEFQKLTLPSIDNLVERVMELGRYCRLFKVDLSRAYRQIFIDFSCVNLLGYYFNGFYYYDCSLSMGSRSSAKCCQKVTDIVMYIFVKDGYFAINYLDDLGGAEAENSAQAAYLHLQEILRNFGLKEALNKSVAPCMVMTFLGIEVNTITLTICIPKEKWKEITKVLNKWLNKDTANLNEVQKLAGLLNFACRCVRPGRVYLSRILNFLREMPKSGQVMVDKDTKQDVLWWVEFAPSYNRTSLMLENKWSEPDEWISTDSCLQGGGIFTDKSIVHWRFPKEVIQKTSNINQLECLMVVIALKIFGSEFPRKKLVIFCDNLNTVLAINSGRSRDRVIQQCLREMHKTLALLNCDVHAQFLDGASNREADLLSRWYLGPTHRNRFRDITKNKTFREVEVALKDWEFIC